MLGSSSVRGIGRRIGRMVFSHRIAALAAVVAIPLGIAATSFALTDNPESPKVPAKVELDSGSPTPPPSRPAPPPVTRSSRGPR